MKKLTKLQTIADNIIGDNGATKWYFVRNDKGTVLMLTRSRKAAKEYFGRLVANNPGKAFDFADRSGVLKTA